ncbi:MAG: hypothetical protein R3E18_07810 [Sphingomonadaceae bacterium]
MKFLTQMLLLAAAFSGLAVDAIVDADEGQGTDIGAGQSTGFPESFIATLPGKSQPTLGTRLDPVNNYYLRRQDLYGSRFIRARDPEKFVEETMLNFGNACVRHGGRAVQDEETRQALSLVSGFDGGGLIGRNEHYYRGCLDQQGQPIAGLVIADHYVNKKTAYIGVYVVRPKAIREAPFYARAYRERLEAERARGWNEWQAQRVAAERARQTSPGQLAPWRSTLSIGEATNCGLVIDVRGPMVEIALDPQLFAPGRPGQIWLRREQVYPVGARDQRNFLIACQGV